MSDNNEKNPEVGDIWVHRKNIKYSVFVAATEERMDAVDLINKKGLSLVIDTDTFCEEYKYLGKSKIKLDKLFEVKSDKLLYFDMGISIPNPLYKEKN